MATNVLLLHYNNYSNRIVRKLDTIAEYKAIDSNYADCLNINFVPGDGVITSLVLGYGTNPTGLFTETKTGYDYLIVYEDTTILSRWFIMETVRTRQGQCEVHLKRDTIADNLETVENATCFIKKGIVQDKDDSAIYNKEEITTNQIKTDEFLLKDETQCGWVVGYVAKQSTANDSSGAVIVNPVSFTEQTIPGVEADDSYVDESYETLDAFYTAHPELVGDMATLNQWSLSVQLDVLYAKFFSYYHVGQTVTVYNNGSVSFKESAYNNQSYLHSYDHGAATSAIWKSWVHDARENYANSLVTNYKSQAFKDAILSQLENKENIKFIDESRLQSFLNFIKKSPVIKIGSKYYKPYDRYGGDTTKSTYADSMFLTEGSTASSLAINNLNRNLPAPPALFADRIDGNPGPETFKLAWSYNKHALVLNEIFAKCKVKLPATVPLLKDAPYYMFAIPYSDDLTIFNGDNVHCKTNRSVAMNAAQALATKAGAGAVYDLQLLPYCPIRDAIKTEKVTAHSTITYGTYQDMYFKNPDFRLDTIMYLWYLEPKINHDYVFTKDSNAYSYILNNTSRGYCIKSSSAIKVRIGENLESPSVTKYDAKKVELRYSNINDTSSTKTFYIYSDEDGQNLLTSITVDAYLNSNNLIGIYMTDTITVGHCSLAFGSVNWTYQLCENGVDNNGIWINTDLLNDYIYYDDYYLSKVDIKNVVTSDIVKMNGDTETSDKVNTVFWCTESKFSFQKFINNYYLKTSKNYAETVANTYIKDEVSNIINDHLKQGSSINDIKVRNQVDMMRIAAPNYSSFFDFNVQRNNGVEYIDVDCTYKPFNPYIHLNPNFKGLYGSDYNDPRGLICGGDFSIAVTTDAWATYQLQNKNYQSIFDRQIQQLETAQSIQAQSDIVNAIAGTVKGGATGAITGAMVGGGYGAIAGAVIGTATSAVGGAIDVYNNQRLRELQISTMKDIHGYQLDNIKALPQGLAKTNYITNNNKLFPYLEFYTCTPIEEMAVRNLLDYNGMTINRIGKISDFQSQNELPYIKAQLIRIDTTEDAHHVQDIANELEMGVYLPKGE